MNDIQYSTFYDIRPGRSTAFGERYLPPSAFLISIRVSLVSCVHGDFDDDCKEKKFILTAALVKQHIVKIVPDSLVLPVSGTEGARVSRCLCVCHVRKFTVPVSTRPT